MMATSRQNLMESYDDHNILMFLSQEHVGDCKEDII